MPRFQLHPRLVEDCHRLGRFRLSHLLLHRNASLPWLILVPETTDGAGELHELAPADRQALVEEVDAVARAVKGLPDVQKVNVAAIGNLVPQLHVHVVGRHPGDPCWPGVVWGNLPSGPAWTAEDIAGMVAAVARSRPLERV